MQLVQIYHMNDVFIDRCTCICRYSTHVSSTQQYLNSIYVTVHRQLVMLSRGDRSQQALDSSVQINVQQHTDVLFTQQPAIRVPRSCRVLMGLFVPLHDLAASCPHTLVYVYVTCPTVVCSPTPLVLLSRPLQLPGQQ